MFATRSRRPIASRLLRLTAAALLSAAAGAPGLASAADPAPLRVVADPNPNFHGVWVDTVNQELLVSDDNLHSLSAFSRTAAGAAAPLRRIQGPSTGLDFPSSVVVDAVNNELWAVMDDTSDRAEVFSRTAVGDVAPLRIIDFKALELTERRTYGWAVDTVNNEVAGTFQHGSTLDFFGRATGEPLRSISGNLTGLADPHGLFIDTNNNEAVVANEGHVPGGGPTQAPSVTVYTRTATGNVAPLRTIQGPSTGLSLPKHVSVDTVNNELAVANSGTNAISVYSRTATGNVAPLRTIAGAATGLNNPTGVFIDNANNEIVVTNWGNHTVTVYPRLANGNVAPSRTLSSGAPTQVGIGNPGAVSVDTTNNEVAVTNCVSHPRVAFFSRVANGTVAPLRTIVGQTTRLSRSMHGVSIDPTNNEVVVPSSEEDAVLAFNRLASGDVAPLRAIGGPATGITRPEGIAVDAINSEIAVVTRGVIPAISVFSRTANGNVAPLRAITDDTGTLSSPVGVWVDTVNNEIVVADGADGAEQIQVYPRTANGPTAPLRVLAGAATMLFKPRQLAVDTTNNEIVVANQGDRAVNPPLFGSLAVYDRLANGNVAPKRFIQQVAQSGVRHPRAVWVDAINNEIGAGDSKFNDLRVFPRVF